MGEVWASLGLRERKNALDKDFSYNSAITVTFNFQNWFKVTAHPLFKSSGYVKYELNGAK